MFDEILLHMTQAALSSGWPLFGLSHSCSFLSPHSIRAFHVQQPRLVILQEGLFKLGRLAAHQSLLGPGGGWRWMKSAKKKVCAAWRYSLVRHWGSMAQVCEDWITSEIGHILPGLKSGMWFQEALPLRAALQNWLEADAGEELLKLGAISYGLHEMKEDLIRFVHPVLEHVWWKPRLEWETCLSPVSLSHWGHCFQSELACQPHDYGAVWSPCPSSVKTNQVRQQVVFLQYPPSRFVSDMSREKLQIFTVEYRLVPFMDVYQSQKERQRVAIVTSHIQFSESNGHLESIWASLGKHGKLVMSSTFCFGTREPILLKTGLCIFSDTPAEEQLPRPEWWQVGFCPSKRVLGMLQAMARSDRVFLKKMWWC